KSCIARLSYRITGILSAAFGLTAFIHKNLLNFFLSSPAAVWCSCLYWRAADSIKQQQEF
ncbi:Hypothetical predicted protein, partial [Podarcis lilfordi]